MLNILRIAATAGMIGAAGLTAAPATADGLSLGFHDHHSRHGFHWSFQTPYGYEDDYVRIRGCTPGRALYKAQAMGVHHARIDYVSERKIGVAGRSHGDHVYVTFARAPGCPYLG